jgi:HD-GYP domain-containing protein (c-di-GMP phosphodiesterase class II)
MRRIIVKEARPGMVAARNVARADGTVLLETGDIIASRHLAALHGAGVYDLWIIDAGFEFFDELCASQPTVAQQRLADGLRKAFLNLAGLVERTQLKRFNLVIEDLVRGMLKNAPAVPCFQALTEDEPLLAHSCDVAALSILLGLKLEGYLVEQRRRLNCKQAREILNLAMGALFHDIGELMLPANQRESRVAGNPDAGDAWKLHIDEGYAIVRGRLDPTAAIIVLHHHQRFDGTGFAIQSDKPALENLRKVHHGQEIHVYARIVMAADIFYQTLYGNCGNVPQPMVKTLWQLQQLPLRTAFDPVIIECLTALCAPFIEGMIVMLNDNRQALVTKVDQNHPCFPQVQTIPQQHSFSSDLDTTSTSQSIDLAITPDLMIDAVDGFPIKPFLFGTRKGRPSVAA